MDKSEVLSHWNMEGWSHTTIFLCCLASAALSGFATLLMSDKPINRRNVMGYIMWFGMAGVGTSMLGFKYLGGKEEPWRVIGSSIFVGMGVVKVMDLGPAALRLLRYAVSPKENDGSQNNKDG